MAAPKIIVVGGGLAGLAAVIKIAEMGGEVDLFSIVPVKRSHSVCAQGGINAAKNLKGEGDSTYKHFDDTIYGGDFLANQPPVKAMCEAAPGIIDLLDRMGVPFNRTPEGLLDFRRFGGTLYNRTAFAGATTGQQLLYALDEQVRRYESEGKVKKYEHWEFLSAVLDGTRTCRGICAMDLRTMEVRTFPADAIIIATGGCGAIFGKSTNSVVCTGSAQSALYQQGCYYANGEFIQVHPTCIPGEDKLRLMSESARGEGGRVWVPRKPQDPRAPQEIPEKERYYFLEERYPAYGNLVPRDIGTREIFKVCVQEGLSVQAGRMCVYLDVTHIPRDQLDRKLAGILEIYEKFQGADPRKVPMKIFPAVHYTMGGLWVDYEPDAKGGLNVGSPRNQQTNVPGLFAIGECEYQYHGANRLGANSLVACIFSGLTMAPGIIAYVNSFKGQKSGELPSGVFDSTRRKHQDYYDGLLKRPQGGPNPYKIHADLGQLMTKSATVVRHNADMLETYGKVCELQQQAARCSVSDVSPWANQTAPFARALDDMFPVAKAILQGAITRDESRGAHFKPEFSLGEITAAEPAQRRREAEAWIDRFEANNSRWLKSTIAACGAGGEPALSYEEVNTSLIPPRPRLYSLSGGDVIEQVHKERQIAAKKT